MNPYINVIMGRGGSMALDAELDYILGEDMFDEEEDKEDKEDDSEDKGEEGGSEEGGEDFFEEEGGSEEAAEEAKVIANKVNKELIAKVAKAKKEGKLVKRSYTKRELKIIKKLGAKKVAAKKKGKLKEVARLSKRIQKIRDRARRRFLKKQGKGSKNEFMHMVNPFALKDNAVIRGMAQPEQDSYIRNKSISSGLLLGAMATGFYALWKREESAEYILQDGSVMSKGQYYENEEYVSLSHTEKESWKDAFMNDPKMTGGVFAAATAIGTFWANSNLKRKLKE